MKWINAIQRYFAWRFVARVEGVTHLVDKDGTVIPGGVCRCYWNLYERGSGKRRFELIGTNYGSSICNYREACVREWIQGGELPPIGPVGGEPVKPRKTADLVVFPGGKDDKPA